VVAMCIARLKIKQFCVPLPTVYVMYFLWISEQSAIISLTELSVFHSLGQWWANFFRSGPKKKLAGHNDLL